MSLRIALLLLLLPGCSAAPYWERAVDDSWALKETRVHRVDALAAGATWAHVDGWAVRNKDGSCDIYIRAGAENPACVEAHERKHCEGWDHPRYPVSIGCTYAPLFKR